jgi:hypothetical protein
VLGVDAGVVVLGFLDDVVGGRLRGELIEVEPLEEHVQVEAR